jgi:hypothetical protein
MFLEASIQRIADTSRSSLLWDGVVSCAMCLMCVVIISYVKEFDVQFGEL